MKNFRLIFLLSVLLLVSACSSSPQIEPTASPITSPPASIADSNQTVTAPTMSPATDQGEFTFNRRATGSGTAKVGDESYTFDIFLCGWSVIRLDEAYPQDSEETAYYGNDLGEHAEFRAMGAGVQEDGSFFRIDVAKQYSFGAASAIISLLVEDNPSMSWTYSEERYSIDRIALDDGHIFSPEPLGFFNKEDVINPVELTFDATCDSYGGTYDTVPELFSEVIGVPLPEPGQGSFVLDKQSYQINPSICGVSEEHAVAEITGEGEQDGEKYRIDLDISGGFSLLSLSFTDPLRRMDPGKITDIPFVIEGKRVYSSEPFNLRESTSPDNPPHTFSLDITCP